jgi:hypothetical protein
MFRVIHHSLDAHCIIKQQIFMIYQNLIILLIGIQIMDFHYYKIRIIIVI